MRRVLFATLVLMVPQPAAAQAERYELGRRLKAFEETWEQVTDPAARRRALKGLPQVTTQFFSFRLGEAGRTLDLAAHALRSELPPPDDVLWARSLFADPESRLVDAEAKELAVVVKPFYPADGPLPKGLTVRLQVGDAAAVTLSPDKFPLAAKVPLPGRAGDTTLSLVASAGKEAARTSVAVSVVERRAGRVAVLEKASARLPAFATIEEATVRDRARLLADLAEGNVPETNLPAAQLLAEAETMLDGKPFFAPRKPGQFWMSVPLGGKKTAPLRVFAPKNLDAADPVPVVFALHGAGGSENLFFEGYGAGHIVKECEKRGWLLVATRGGLGFGTAPPVPEVFEQLAKRYPLDAKKVFVVGHSMGAGHAVQLVQKHPKFFAGAAALGGGGAVRDKAAFASLPVFVGVGDKDFALAGARALGKALPKAVYKEYPDVEHMAIVREALPDVFDLFDK